MKLTERLDNVLEAKLDQSFKKGDMVRITKDVTNFKKKVIAKKGDTGEVLKKEPTGAPGIFKFHVQLESDYSKVKLLGDTLELIK